MTNTGAFYTFFGLSVCLSVGASFWIRHLFYSASSVRIHAFLSLNVRDLSILLQLLGVNSEWFVESLYVILTLYLQSVVYLTLWQERCTRCTIYGIYYYMTGNRDKSQIIILVLLFSNSSLLILFYIYIYIFYIGYPTQFYPRYIPPYLYMAQIKANPSVSCWNICWFLVLLRQLLRL